MDIKKIAKIIGFGIGIVAAAYFIFAFSPLLKTHAAGTGAPTVTFIPANDPHGKGDINGGELNISGSGPFTQDFKVTLCLQDENGSVGTACVSTPWASAAAAAGTSQISDGHYVPGYTAANANTWWSAWAGSAGSGPWLQSSGSPFITVQTQSLPAGDVLNNVQLGIDFIENDVSNPSNGPSCLHVLSGTGLVPDPDTGVADGVFAHGDGAEYTPIGGGTSVVGLPALFNYGSYPAGFAYGWTHGNCGDSAALSNTPNYFRIYMSAESYNASGVSNNIPSSTTVSQNVTTGFDSNPVEIMVRNTGGTAWKSDQSTVIAGSQTPGSVCDGSGGTQPAASNPQGTSCTVSLNNYSDIFELQHISGAFAVGSDPAQYDQVTKNTCTIGATACANNACNTSASCTSPTGLCPGPGTGAYGQACNSQLTCSSTGCGGTWIAGCNSTWGPQIQCSVVSGDPNVEPGASTVFKLNSLTAPATAGPYTETWQMLNKGGTANFGSLIPVSIQVGPVTSGGTIKVLSQSSVGSTPVSAGWYFSTFQSTDPCGTANTICGPTLWETNSVSNNLPVGPYNLYTYPQLAPSNYNNGYLYTLRSVSAAPIAFKQKVGNNSLFALAKNLLVPIANAAHADPSYPWSQTLTATAPTNQATMIILWDPEAALKVNVGSVSISNANPTGSFTIQNDGTPGSTSTWNAAVSNYSANGSGWLTVSPSTGTNLTAGAAPTTVTVSANTTGLGSGTYTAKVSFSGNSFPSGLPLDPNAIPSPITVTLTVTSGGATSYVYCVDAATDSCNSTTTNTGYKSCATACSGSPTSCTVKGLSVTCPSPLQEGSTTQCHAGITEAGTCTGTVTWSVPNGVGSITQNGDYTAPTNSTGTASIKVVSTDNSNWSASTTIPITGPVGTACTTGDCPVCKPLFLANPASIVVPESSNLAYNCQYVNACSSITGSDGSSYQVSLDLATDIASGTQWVKPASTTVYTFSCWNTKYTGSTATVNSSVQVTVGGSGVCETNPNGTGCPGQ